MISNAIAETGPVCRAALALPQPAGPDKCVHSLSLRAADQAGNQSETSLTVNVDTTTPELTLSLNGAPGAGGWYLSPLEISASASDTDSGLSTLEYTLDGGPWTPYTAPPSACQTARTVTNSAP